jgi:secreted trypsin-like serine protease
MFLLAALVTVSLALTANSRDEVNGSSVSNNIINEQSDRTRLAKLKKTIDAEIGKPRAKRLTQCRVIAFGAKPCGGPRTYLVYSNLKTNEPKLKRLVSEYNSLEEKLNREGNLGSDCMFVGEPQITLLNGMCRIKRN